ncbi:MAG: HisA/HisF-related TIM barrel protein [Thermoplasmata archaeon]|nr:HisA/HisF-related TIM barrel protein [Thermoplasmata archaeon]
MSELASKLSEKFERLYLADEDGIVKNKPQLDLAQAVCDEIPTLYECGVRFSNNVIDVITAGADRAVLGSSTISNLDELRGAFMLSENITFKVDYRDGILSFDPHIAGRAFHDLARDVHDIGISEIVVPSKLAKDAGAAKKQFGFRLGVIASMSERQSLEALGADYLVAEDFGSMDGNE